MIQSIDRAIDIINIVANSNDHIPTLKFIAEETKLNKSTCYHIIETLIAKSLLIKPSSAKGYSLGPLAYLWTNSGRFLNEFTMVAKPVLKWLHKKLGKTVTLATIINKKKYLIDYLESDFQINHKKVSLLEDNIYNSATGLLLLANSDKNDMLDIYSMHNIPNSPFWIDVKTFPDFVQKLELIKNQKVFKNIRPNYEDDDPDYEYFGYSALVKTECRVYGAVGVACKTLKNTTLPDAEEKEIIKCLVASSVEIVKRLGETKTTS